MRYERYTYKHAQGRDERNDLKEPPKGEKDVPKHGKILPQC